MAKIGDTVRYLNSVGGGTIVRIEGNVAYVDEDGFETPTLLSECVVVAPAATHVPPYGKSKNSADVAKSAPKPQSKDATPKPKEEVFVVQETPGGEKLNVVLAYEADDLKRISSTVYYTYLVNDSNYYLYFTYLTAPDDSSQWTVRYDGLVEPGIQTFIGELTPADLADIGRVAVQYVPFKRGKAFDLKQPGSVNLRIDSTKFFKLHCFRPNPYFDQPVIALDIVTDDVPAKPLAVKAEDINKALRAKIVDDKRKPKPVQKHPHKNDSDQPLVVDLHITELVDNTRGLSSADMLNLQIDTFCRVMDENIKNHGKKIVFIHGKGDGVLRSALMKELNHRYKGHDVQDASFLEYGYGATQVKIR